MVKVRVSFRQSLVHGIGTAKSLVKEIELAAIPVPGSLFEYERGWGLCFLVGCNETGMHLTFCKDSIEIDGYGPHFDADEVKSLLALGWEIL